VRLIDHVLDDGFELQCGLRTRGLRLRCEVHGELDADGGNAVLFPTWFAGRHAANRWIIGPGRGLDTARLCVIVVNAFGNGESSSPSNDPQLLDGGSPVPTSLWDNVRAQQALVDSLGIRSLHAVVGRSMGAQHALQWGCLHPERVERVFAFCGVPKTTAHNQLLLDAMDDALCAEDTEAGLRLAARIYLGWCYSQEFFGAADGTRAWAERQLLENFRQFDARDLLTLVRSWRAADISANPVFGGSLQAALGAIRARTLLMPISHDLIFPPRDVEAAQAAIRGAQSWLLVSPWGHRAAAPGGRPDEIATLELALKKFLLPERLTTWESLSLVMGRVLAM
jgi:homoserine O-acetyltransferase